MTDISKINELAAALDSSNAINPIAKRNSRANFGYRPKERNTRWLSNYAKKVVSLGYAREGLENFGGAMKNLAETGDPKYLLDYVGPGAIGHVPGAVLQTAFHGSPHKFDKFDMSKIGTGEGAQAYGHGLYFAENPEIAKFYQKVAGQKSVGTTWDGQWAVFKDDPTAHGGRTRISEPFGSRGQAEAALTNLPDDSNFYTVDIPDDAVSKMLDWDAPLSEQPHVLEAIKGTPLESFTQYADRMTGKDVISQLGGLSGSAEASKKLRGLGIPGVKYLDGLSRESGEGMRNFVVFDDSLPKILKRE